MDNFTVFLVELYILIAKTITRYTDTEVNKNKVTSFFAVILKSFL